MSCTVGPAPSWTRPMGCARKAAGSGKMAAAVLLAVGLRTARRALAAAGSRGVQVRSNQRDLGARRHWRDPGPARASRIIAESLTLPRVNFRDSAVESAREAIWRRPLPRTAGASRLGPSWWCCWPGACFGLPLLCPLQEVSSPSGASLFSDL